jgi:Domain of unknown function (DUF4429)
MQANGKTGTVHLSNGAVTIQRKGSVGWRASTGAVETRIPIGEIAAIELTAASILSNGVLRLVVADTHDWKRFPDEGAVAFTYRQNAAFEALAAQVTEAIAGRRRLVAC